MTILAFALEAGDELNKPIQITEAEELTHVLLF